MSVRVRERPSLAPRVVVLENAGQPYAMAAALAASGLRLTTSIARARVVVLDALDTLRAIRAKGHSTPVLAVFPDVVAALNAGADECITPPFSAAGLAASIRALLDRIYGRVHWRPVPIRIGRLEICPVTREAASDGVPVSLRPKEHALLLALLRNHGRVLTRSELLARVWPERTASNTRTLDTHIGWLRKKIELDVKEPRVIRTVPSVGYLITTMPAPAPWCAP